MAVRRDLPEATVRAAARPLRGSSRDYDDLLRSIGDAQIVLIGEASHGTHEFYEERARLKVQSRQRPFVPTGSNVPSAWSIGLGLSG